MSALQNIGVWGGVIIGVKHMGKGVPTYPIWHVQPNFDFNLRMDH